MMSRMASTARALHLGCFVVSRTIVVSVLAAAAWWKLLGVTDFCFAEELSVGAVGRRGLALRLR